MTNNPAGLLVVFAFLAAAIGSVPFALSALLLARRVRPFSHALRYAGLGAAALVVVLAVVVAFVSPAAGVVVAVLAAVTGAVLWTVPLLVARAVLMRRGVDTERALRTATLGLPVAFVTSLFVAFGDFGRYNITFLTGTEATLAWTALALTIFVGPTAVGLAAVSLGRLVQGDSRTQ